MQLFSLHPTFLKCKAKPVKLVAQLQLKPRPWQYAALMKTLREANAACDWLSQYAFETRTFQQYSLHRLAYAECRKVFSKLGAQVVIRCLAKVADSYKLDQKTVRTFEPRGALAFDQRNLSIGRTEIDIWTVDARMKIEFVCGEKQRALLVHPTGESDLEYRDGRFYLLVSVDVPEPEERAITGYLGVDVGIKNIAALSDGSKPFAGTALNALRARASRLRAKLQQLGTKSAKRLLKKRRCKESRFSKHTNHHISKQIVATAERTGLGIALENLEGIRQRTRVSRSQRRALHSWAFGDLQAKIVYKALLAGIPVCFVDPRYTSCECRVCGHIAKGNRRTRDLFVCQACGHSQEADSHAACVIASRAEVIRPYAVNVDPIVSRGVELQSFYPGAQATGGS